MSLEEKKYYYKDKALEDLPGEYWADIPDFEDIYQISNLGRVKSLERYVNHKSGKPILLKPRILSQTTYKYFNKHAGDYSVALRVCLGKENRRYDFQVRRLMYAAFIGALDPTKCVANADGDGYNNRIENVTQITLSEIQRRSIDKGRCVPSLINADRSKFKKTYGGYSKRKPIAQYSKDGLLIKEYPSIKAASRGTGHDEKSIITVAKGRWSHHHGYVWKYI